MRKLPWHPHDSNTERKLPHTTTSSAHRFQVPDIHVLFANDFHAVSAFPNHPLTLSQTYWDHISPTARQDVHMPSTLSIESRHATRPPTRFTEPSTTSNITRTSTSVTFNCVATILNHQSLKKRCLGSGTGSPALTHHEALGDDIHDPCYWFLVLSHSPDEQPEGGGLATQQSLTGGGHCKVSEDRCALL